MKEPQEHTGSYYAATANHLTDYAPLRGERRAEVCVIGAGFSGISSALHLAERGYQVRVVEANRVGWGASGRNGGQLIGGISGEARLARRLGLDGRRILWDLRWAGHEIIRERVRTYGIDCDLKWGYLDVAIKPRHLRDQQREFDAFEEHGAAFEYRRLSREEVEATIGTRAYIGGLLNMGNGHLHPLNLCIGEARAAVRLGAIIHEQSPVLNIEEGRKARVVTSDGSVSADFVVLAVNAYDVVDRRLRGHLFPVNSFIIATEPLEPERVAEINPRGLAVCDPNFLLEYFRLSADKRLLFGGRFNYGGVEPEKIRRFMRRKMHRIYPQLRKAKIDYAWGGTIGVTLNRVPQLGRLANNILYLQGYCGHGVNVTHLAGQIMAEAVAGTLERFDMFSGVKPVLVPGAHRFRNALVSLGMLYYRIRDRL